jgi:hypothetical protein
MRYTANDFINDLKLKKAIKKVNSYGGWNVEDVAKEILDIAGNTESFYKKKDAKGAVEYAKREYEKYGIEKVKGMSKEAAPIALKQLLKNWKEEGHI